MSKPKAEAGAPAMNPELSLVVELRNQVEVIQGERDHFADRMTDAVAQVRHLEKVNAALKEENDALHCALRDAQCARSHAEGRAEALEAFTPEVMVPRNRFPGPASLDLKGWEPRQHWFQGS
ncbi:MAG: hypothetical protein KA233_03150 [Novosphingobium sp.]|nr:hypothetical protein [Novosphingobium sp.]